MFKIDQIIMTKDENKIAVIQDLQDNQVLLDIKMLFDLMEVARMKVLGIKPNMEEYERLTDVSNIRLLSVEEIAENKDFINKLFQAGYFLYDTVH